MQLSVTTPSLDSLLAAFPGVGALPTSLPGATATAGVPTLDGFADVLANTVAPAPSTEEKNVPPLIVATPVPVIVSSWLPTPEYEETPADPMAAPRVDSLFPTPAKSPARPTDETVAAALALIVPQPVAVPPEPETIELTPEEPAPEGDAVDAEERGAPDIPFSSPPIPMPRLDGDRAPEIFPTAKQDFPMPAPREMFSIVPQATPTPATEGVTADIPIGRVLIPYAAPRVARTTEIREVPERAPTAPAPLPDVAKSQAVTAPLGNPEPREPAVAIPVAAVPVAAPRIDEESPLRAVEPRVVPDDTAKIAVAPAPAAPKIFSRESLAPRNFVSSPEKQLTPRRANLGTGVAKTIDAMPYASTSPRASAPADFEPVSLVVERATPADESDATAPTPEPATVSTAHRAVEAVLTAAHRFSTGERHAVSLQFSVGGADLDVRVELRADEVRATFRTDSADLRAALAQEWDAAALAGGDRSFRLAPPVFVANDASGFSAFSGDQAAHQQQRQSASRRASDFPTAGVARGRGIRDAIATSDFVSNSAPRVPLSTALHLHTLA